MRRDERTATPATRGFWCPVEQRIKLRRFLRRDAMRADADEGAGLAHGNGACAGPISGLQTNLVPLQFSEYATFASISLETSKSRIQPARDAVAKIDLAIWR